MERANPLETGILLFGAAYSLAGRVFDDFHKKIMESPNDFKVHSTFRFGVGIEYLSLRHKTLQFNAIAKHTGQGSLERFTTRNTK